MPVPQFIPFRQKLKPATLPSFYSFLFLFVVCPALAQQSDLSQRLIGRPLYLREAWLNDKIEFSAWGEPIGEVHRGPLTLGGVDIKKIKLERDRLEMWGERVALISPGAGMPLVRSTAVASTTRIWPTMRRGNGQFYRATEAIQFTVHADAHGSFDAALTRIFADGLDQLAITAPSYWRCYAASYFVDSPISPDAGQDVERCAERQSTATHPPGESTQSGFSPPAVVRDARSAFTRGAAEMGITGVSTIYLTVEANGAPSDFQVIEPLGAGLDEESLEAVSHFVFRPATQDGKPVPAGVLVNESYGTQ
jgi:Gram-negative bacterial TonB protein C-terminal